MNASRVKQIRNQLLARLDRLQGTASRTVSDMKNNGVHSADPIDHAALEHDRQVELTIRGREWNAIQEIQETIRRMDQGLFGTCVICGSTIAERRLLAEPTTRLCRDCQELAELHIGSNGDSSRILSRSRTASDSRRVPRGEGTPETGKPGPGGPGRSKDRSGLGGNAG